MKHLTTTKILMTTTLLFSLSGIALADNKDKDGTINDYGATSCSAIYQSNIPPSVTNNLSDGSIEHCHPNNVPSYDNLWSFSNLISPISHGPIYSAELLTESNVEKSRGVSRKGITFFNDPSVPMNYQGVTSDYNHTGYDRGHMANWADGANPQTFELTNIVPQDANNNRQLWEKIEVATRNITKTDEKVYVISGPVYDDKPEHLNGSSSILVPSYLFKCINSSSYHGCYVVKNSSGWDYIKVSYSNIANFSGVNPFPGDNANKDTIALPNPKDGKNVIDPVSSLGSYHAGSTASGDHGVGRYKNDHSESRNIIEPVAKGAVVGTIMHYGLKAYHNYHH